MAKPTPIGIAVEAARGGDLRAFAILVEATQDMAYAVAWQVLRQESDARDVVQESYISAFKRLAELLEPDAFAGWLRRIVVASSLNHRRRTRAVWVSLANRAAPPILDDDEKTWTEEQQRQLARALLALSEEERRVCELHYHGRWSMERLARRADVDVAAMRKRMQRIRDKLRKEIEMDEHHILGNHSVPRDLPLSITELLARPRLVDLPENPVGAVLAILRGAFAGKPKARRTSKPFTSSSSLRSTIEAHSIRGGLPVESSTPSIAHCQGGKSVSRRRTTPCASGHGASMSLAGDNGPRSWRGASTPTGSFTRSVPTPNGRSPSVQVLVWSGWPPFDTASMTFARFPRRGSREAEVPNSPLQTLAQATAKAFLDSPPR